MATKTWIGNAHSVKQINTITVANTWAAGDTATCTINGKDLIVTCGSTTTTTATVATAIKEAWMSATRLDGTSSSSNATSNFGGQEFGEFSEVTASISGSVVTLIGNEAGNPFVVTVTENTAGTGTATGAASTVCTGNHYWDNADNWDTGTVPANDDIVVFRDSDVSCKFGLPNSDGATPLEVTIQQWMSYTGEVGLPAVNVNTVGKPYYEYRQRYIRLNDAGTGTDIAHRFGLGKDGIGCRLFNLKHLTLKCSPIVYNTGPPLASRIGTKALNICCTANTSTLTIVNGSVEFSSQDSGTSAFVTVKQTAGDSRGVTAIHTTGGVVTINSGTMIVGGAGAIDTINCNGGTLRAENQTGTLSILKNYTGGTVNWASAGTISTYYSFGGAFDARESPGFTMTNGNLYKGSTFYDPMRTMTVGSAFYILYDPVNDLDFGSNELTSRVKVV